MRRYLLDAGPLAALLLSRSGAVSLMTPWLMRREAATSIVVYGEVFEYIKTRPNFPTHHQGLLDLLTGVYPYFLTYQVLERYAEIRLQMRRPYGPGLIGDIDTLIAATALTHDLTLVTTDGAFGRVPELSLMLLDRLHMAVIDSRS